MILFGFNRPHLFFSFRWEFIMIFRFPIFIRLFRFFFETISNQTRTWNTFLIIIPRQRFGILLRYLNFGSTAAASSDGAW